MAEVKDQCAKCSGEMKIGFVYDKAHLNSATYLVWGDGEPKVSSWTGVKPSGEQRINIDKVTRCNNCGFLEFYATGDHV